MRGWRLCLVCFAAVVIATAPHASARTSHVTGLYRVLHLPRVEPGAACPISRPDPAVGFARFGIAPGIGQGPAYPIGMPRGVLSLAPATGADADSQWAARRCCGSYIRALPARC